MKTTKDFNMSLYYTIITSASSHKRLLEDEQKKALSERKKRLPERKDLRARSYNTNNGE
jgi:TfoX/Sxy family transcriptional regulator of competence genes